MGDRPRCRRAPGLLMAWALPAALLLLLSGCSGAAAELQGSTDLLAPGGLDAAAAATLSGAHRRPLELDELPLDEMESEGLLDGQSRRMLKSVLGGPLPGLSLIPGFPGAGGRIPGPGGAGLGPFASYVVRAQDPIAIALRQLSIIAIAAYGTAVQDAIKLGTKAIDAELARLRTYLQRQAKALTSANAQTQLAQVQREIRALVVARAALKDLSAREVRDTKFLTAATSAWVSWYYGIQYRFSTMTLNIQWANDPIQLELNRVLFSLADLNKLIGLLLGPFVDAFQFEQSFFNELANVILAASIDERNRFTVTPVATFNDPIGSGKNLAALADQIASVSKKLGTGRNAEALLKASTAMRDNVAKALAVPAGGSGTRPRSDALNRLGQLLRQGAASALGRG
ncbi:hypothetical protein HYH03_007460 [Edaphochlamys debaryana]|uniref:Uncharacterized protein n=1 Tax=Edaphochlamys debaryana TaxID=47281 RepID=A0A835Y476_9CHLO|nr:hypothetical protein HYH03_007460 [Edaphochlamys debaryana]|eukprot:KAG2494408.1 hypothetical protein HYH03_007460 [Edaphochlamys debaryana]